MKYIGIAGLLVMILGLGTVNVQHHLNIPNELLTRDVIHQTHFINSEFPFLHQQTDIQLNDEIHGLNSIRVVDQILQQAYYYDVVVFHLAGYGGEVGSVFTIIDNVHASKAHVKMVVESPVYSGHAYLALSGDELVVQQNAYVMLHTTTEIDLDCTKQTGYDRGVSNIEHCQAMKDADLILMNRVIDLLLYVTPEEKIMIKTGHDIYLDSTIVNSRVFQHG